jgi:uncharacterized protein (DUF3820 family)
MKLLKTENIKLLQILLEEDGPIRYKVIGFANKYYTLWEVEIDDNIIIYTYIKNLSFNLEDAKIKAGTDKFEESLRGRSKTFTKIKYDDGSTQEFEGFETSKVLSSRMTFGKYRGEEILKIANKDPKYLAWVITDTSGNSNLKMILSTLDPVKKLLSSNKDYTSKEESNTDYITSIQDEFEEYYGMSLKWNFDASKYMLKSVPISLKATLKTPGLSIYDPDKKSPGNKVIKGYKNVLFDAIPDKEIRVSLKREMGVLMSMRMIAVVQGVTPEAYGTPPLFKDFAIPENMKDAKYEFRGHFIIPTTQANNFEDRARNYIYFACTSLKLA